MHPPKQPLFFLSSACVSVFSISWRGVETRRRFLFLPFPIFIPTLPPLLCRRPLPHIDTLNVKPLCFLIPLERACVGNSTTAVQNWELAPLSLHLMNQSARRRTFFFFLGDVPNSPREWKKNQINQGALQSLSQFCFETEILLCCSTNIFSSKVSVKLKMNIQLRFWGVGWGLVGFFFCLSSLVEAWAEFCLVISSIRIHCSTFKCNKLNLAKLTYYWLVLHDKHSKILISVRNKEKTVPVSQCNDANFFKRRQDKKQKTHFGQRDSGRTIFWRKKNTVRFKREDASGSKVGKKNLERPKTGKKPNTVTFQRSVASFPSALKPIL